MVSSEWSVSSAVDGAAVPTAAGEGAGRLTLFVLGVVVAVLGGVGRHHPGGVAARRAVSAAAAAHLARRGAAERVLVAAAEAEALGRLAPRAHGEPPRSYGTCRERTA